MEPAEISLLILRHLARDGCTETIRTYMTECPIIKESLGVSCNRGVTDVENFRQKLLNRSVNISLIDLLSEYGRAKSMIRDLVTKLLYEWRALSTFDFLSPHDSMATQLAHITKFLETKCKACQTDFKCIGTSDHPDMLTSQLPQIATATVENLQVRIPGHDIGVQTSEPDEEPSDLPNIVNSLLDPPVIDKIVQIANKELNRSTQSNENPTGNDTETEIDKMLLDILHGIGGPVTSLPSNALNTGYNNMDLIPGPVEPQLLALFQDAQSIIENTPISGTLGRPEDSASKHRTCGSFLDLIETPYKSSFLSNPNTPVIKANTIQPPVTPVVDQSLEKLNCKPVELNFGTLGAIAGPSNVPSSTPQVCSVLKPLPPQVAYIMPKQKTFNVPKYSIIRPPESKLDLVKLRRKRDIRPKIPAGAPVQPVHQGLSAQSSVVSNNQTLNRSASKRKFSTPVKLSPARAMHSTVNFYCSSSSQDRLDREMMTPKSDKSSYAPASDTPYLIPRSSSIATPDKADTCTSFPVITTDSLISAESQQSMPLATINYQDLECPAKPVESSQVSVVSMPPLAVDTEPEPTLNQIAIPSEAAGTSASPALLFDQVVANVNPKTPDLGISEKNSLQQEQDEGSSPQRVYNRLLASVRHSRPSNTLLNKKSFSTPRKKGHIRNLMFKTPPGAQSERTENSSILSLEDSIRSLKRKALSPSPNSSQPLGSKSKKRLKWTVTVPEVKLSETIADEKSFESEGASIPPVIFPTTTASVATTPTSTTLTIPTLVSHTIPPCTTTAPPASATLSKIPNSFTPIKNSNAPINKAAAPISNSAASTSKPIVPVSNSATTTVVPAPVAPSIPVVAKVTMEEVVSKLTFAPVQKNCKGRGRKSNKPVDKAEVSKDSKPKVEPVKETESEQSRSRTRNKRSSKTEQEESSGGPSIVSPPSTLSTPSPATKLNRRKNAKFDDHKAAEAAVINAVPLGTRSAPLPKYRMTRGKSNLLVNQSPDTTKEADITVEVRPNTAALLPAPATVPIGSQQKPSMPQLQRILPKVIPEKQSSKSIESSDISSDLRQQTHKDERGLLDPDARVSKTVTHAYKTRNAVRGKGKDRLLAKPLSTTAPQLKEIAVDIGTTSEIVSKSKTLDTSSSNEDSFSPSVGANVVISTDARTLPVNTVTTQPTDKIPVLKIEAPTPNNHVSSGSGSRRVGDTNTPFPLLTGKEIPTKGRPKSPRKVVQSQGKVLPRRILPKPVPPDYPRVTFPPTSQNSSYILSIPVATPTKDGMDIDGSLSMLTRPSPSFMSPITTTSLLVKTPQKLPKLSSDSSSDFNSSSVPKTPRLKNDSGEESCSMHSRLYLGDRTGPGGAGMPIFSSTPLKFDVPETPGKTITSKITPVVAPEGENSTQSSLFDTPMKADSPPNASALSDSSVQLPVKIQFLTISPAVSFTPRKSPRKAVTTPIKMPIKKKTPRKSNVPIKSVQNLPVKPSYEFKPIRKTPYKSPLAKKGSSKVNTSNASLTTSTVPHSSSSSPTATVSNATEAIACTDKPTITAENNSMLSERSLTVVNNATTTSSNNTLDAKTSISSSSNFASLFSKAKSLKRLADGAKRRAAGYEISSSVNGGKNVETLSTTLSSKSLPGLQQPPQKQTSSSISPHVSRSSLTTRVLPDVRAESKVKTNKFADVHFQFAVSGRAKQLSLSEHESILGLLQIGSLSSEGKKQLQHSQVSQGLETDLLSTIDLHTFLRTVHAGE